MPRWPIELVHRVDNRLPVRADVLDAVVEIEDPVQRLRGRRDVVGLGTEYEDGRGDVAQIETVAIR